MQLLGLERKQSKFRNCNEILLDGRQKMHWQGCSANKKGVFKTAFNSF